MKGKREESDISMPGLEISVLVDGDVSLFLDSGFRSAILWIVDSLPFVDLRWILAGYNSWTINGRDDRPR